jgi:hypothetical protein
MRDSTTSYTPIVFVQPNDSYAQQMTSRELTWYHRITQST